jgi:FkbM family methyltransferase
MLRKCRAFDFELLVPADDSMLQPLLMRGEYESHVVPAFLERITGESVVLDIGANIGVYTVAAARVAKRVIAIEVSNENAKIIAANLNLNGLSNAVVWPVAVPDRVEMATFLLSGGSNKFVRAPLPINVETLDKVGVAMAVPLDKLLDEPVDVVKIDIEGREYAALKGATRLLNHRPVFFIEFSPVYIHVGCGVSHDKLLTLFYERGYQATILHRGGREFIGQNTERLMQAYSEDMSRKITHLDLMFACDP